MEVKHVKPEVKKAPGTGNKKPVNKEAPSGAPKNEGVHTKNK